MVDAIVKELDLQKGYLGNEAVETIYFGGGTPSLLDDTEIKRILHKIHDLNEVASEVEITLEANPDDLNTEKLRTLYQAGVNRLSIGVQTFDEEVLEFLNRAHNKTQAEVCLNEARAIGFSNLSLDLIYGIPGRSHEKWCSDLSKALEYSPEHISTYSLTVEPNTVFGRKHASGHFNAVGDEEVAQQFEIMLKYLNSLGYLQYEVSNFCLQGFYSRHNSNYWKQKKYLGIGPSAHSYDLKSRQFNISKNGKYIKAITQDLIPAEREILNKNDNINEYLLTTLRTMWGANLRYLNEELNYNVVEHHKSYLDKLEKTGKAEIRNEYLILTNSGKLIADKISSDLFKI